jgi:predicted dehydrogenase
VAAEVPAHRELELATLAEGKAVYSESPLGATVAQTEEAASRWVVTLSRLRV